MRDAKSFRNRERVKFAGSIHLVVDTVGGWLTLVPENKTGSLTSMIENTVKARAKDVLIGVVCFACDWPCDCEEWGINK